MIGLGAQLYTVRDCFLDDRAIGRTLLAIREIGYDAVQLFGSAAFAARLAKAAKAAGLRILGVLADVDAYEQDLDAYLRLCQTYDVPDLGISGFVTDADKVAPYIERVNKMAQRICACGRSFSYHNHAAEFIRLPDGKTIMDHYIDGFDALVDFMPDTYWIHKGGCDVRRFLERLSGRVKLLHLKDMAYTDSGDTFAEVGYGNLYMDGIIDTALKVGVRQFVVEQDRCDGDPLESLRKSFEYIRLRKLL